MLSDKAVEITVKAERITGFVVRTAIWKKGLISMLNHTVLAGRLIRESGPDLHIPDDKR